MLDGVKELPKAIKQAGSKSPEAFEDVAAKAQQGICRIVSTRAAR
jgi:hypothetical protein